MEQQEYTYETAIARLEQVIGQLDAGDLPLESSITLFQDGLQMVKICQEKLQAAEGKLQQLRGDSFVEMGE